MFRFTKSTIQKTERGFTILEVLMAIFVLTLGVSASFALVQQSVASVNSLKSKLVAAYLVQEGMELIKNVRDTNLLTQREDPILAWDENLPPITCGSYFEIDYKNQILCYSGEGHYLNNESAGFYSYSAGDRTIFKRKITIDEKTEGPLEGMKVTVEVSWQDRGIPRSLKAIEYIYNWY